MQTNNCLTIDVGTTNTKVTLWSKYTKVLKKFETPKNIHGNQVDFNLPKLWQNLLTNLKNFNKTELSKVKSISIASVGESGILLDKKTKQEAGHCIAWFDERSEVILNKLTAIEKNVYMKLVVCQ
ncbi:FGGY family carbohydrate kinase [Lactobacillus sp. ESL0677]|uniref:FGGY family carbohydrate kinase n=1 Tax=Lactobacillus sp. ESL0677 TaxID=2983208 RepID=UPI0023F71DA4|nr:FGGY family carbohydrate kinase [Lactobacillus sp. ESL0677]WEV36268.1 FGGY family carbohydrate kinase [Lactobacillus sp. ESL0677]